MVYTTKIDRGSMYYVQLGVMHHTNGTGFSSFF